MFFSVVAFKSCGAPSYSQSSTIIIRIIWLHLLLINTKNTCRSLWSDVICAVVQNFIHPNESLATPFLILIIVDGVQHDAVAVFVVVDVDKAA